MRYDAVLFDLDGTLIGLRPEEFISAYFDRIGRWVSARMDPEPFLQLLGASTRAMLQSEDAGLTNEEVFLDHFVPGIPGLDREETLELFDRFYEEEFPRLRHLCRALPAARPVVRTLRESGRLLVLATNPVFPRVAIEQRLRWGGLEPEDFDHISSYENSSCCKPSLGYYRDLVQRSGMPTDRILMVGNDPWEDMVAGKLGMDTFLVEEYLVERPREVVFTPTYRGSLEEVMSAVGC
jgi:FMN phosphatase YigB (HAD superfamily)